MKKFLSLSLVTLLTATSAMAFNVTAREYVPVNQKKLQKASDEFVLQGTVSGASRVAVKDAPSNALFYESFDGTTASSWKMHNNADASSGVYYGLGSLTNTAALSGSYYVISGYDASHSRDFYAISPGIQLEAGKTYYMNGYVYCPGYGGVKDEFRFTVGRDTTNEAQTTVLLDKTGSNAESLTAFTLRSGVFTPTESGVYYFAFNHCTAALDVNAVAFEDFSITEGEIALEPVVTGCSIEGGMASMTETGKYYVGSEDALYFNASYVNADTCYWTLPGTYYSMMVQNGLAAAIYNNSGEYTAVATAANAAGTKTATEEFGYKVSYVTTDTKESDYVGNTVNPDNNAYYSFTNNGGPVVGLNTYFKGIYEYYEAPVKVAVDKVKFKLTRYSLSDANKAKDVKVQVMTVVDSSLVVVKESSVIASELFGSNVVSDATGPRELEYTFDEPVEVEAGVLLVGFDFSAMTYSSTQLLAFDAEYGNLLNSTYAMYNNSMTSLSNLLSNSPVYNAAIYPHVTFNPEPTAIEDAVASKTVAGVTYYNLAGVASATPHDGMNIVVTNYTDGTKQAAKVVK